MHSSIIELFERSLLLLPGASVQAPRRHGVLTSVAGFCTVVFVVRELHYSCHFDFVIQVLPTQVTQNSSCIPVLFVARIACVARFSSTGRAV
jgi:hypothetical protein